MAARGVSYREAQVLIGVSEGLTRKEIGRKLYLSEDTVKTHLKRITFRYGMDNQVSAPGVVSEALRRGDLDFDSASRRIVIPAPRDPWQERDRRKYTGQHTR